LDSEDILAMMLKRNYEAFSFLKCIFLIWFTKFKISNCGRNPTPLCKCTWFVIYLLYAKMQRFCFVLSVETLLGHLKDCLYFKTLNFLNNVLNDPQANNCSL
jgi:hypothetical protein